MYTRSRAFLSGCHGMCAKGKRAPLYRAQSKASNGSVGTHARTHHGELLLEALVGVVDQQLLERIALFWFVVGGGGG